MLSWSGLRVDINTALKYVSPGAAYTTLAIITTHTSDSIFSLVHSNSNKLRHEKILTSEVNKEVPIRYIS